jgi:hypothetical protein
VAYFCQFICSNPLIRSIQGGHTKWFGSLPFNEVNRAVEGAMMNSRNYSQIPRVTEEPETMDEMYQRLRIQALPERLQRLVLLHYLDQFQAVPSYIEQQARRFALEPQPGIP